MPRISRKSLGTGYFHVMVQGDNKKFIFQEGWLKRKYISFLFGALEKTNAKILCYCIMGNHAHVLIYIDKNKDLSKTMNLANQKYSLLYNHTKKRCGHVFRDRYRSQKIMSIKHLENCIRYIHLNPVTANICKREADYQYSSYNDFISKKIPPEIIQLAYGDDPHYMRKIKSKLIESEHGQFIDID